MHQRAPVPLVRPGSAPAPNSLQQACPQDGGHAGERAGRRGGYSPYCPEPYHMHTGSQLADKGETKHLHGVPADPGTTLCLPFVQGASVGRMQRSSLHPALPLPRGCLVPSSSIISTQLLQDSFCSRALHPDTKPCFGFGKPRQS